jgi:putative transposase
MRDWQSQAHVRYYCKYHVVFVPKYRKQTIYGSLRRDIGGILRDLCRQQGVELIEGYAMRDHIYLLLMIPPKYSVANKENFDGSDHN